MMQQSRLRAQGAQFVLIYEKDDMIPTDVTGPSVVAYEVQTAGGVVYISSEALGEDTRPAK